MKKVLSYLSLLVIFSLTSVSLVNADSHEKKMTTGEASTEAASNSTETAEAKADDKNDKKEGKEEEPDCE
ncbi:MAG: hypothetical protein V3U71_05545 [Cocleimonas sp.]